MLRGGPGPKRYRQLKRELEAGRTRRPIIVELLHPHRPLEDEGGKLPVANCESAALRIVKFIHPDGWEKCLEIMAELVWEFSPYGDDRWTSERHVGRMAADARQRHYNFLDHPSHLGLGYSAWWVSQAMADWLGHAALRANGVGGKRQVYNLWWRRCMCAFAFARPKTSELE